MNKEEVKALQRKLNAEGYRDYNGNKLVVDGKLGKLTRFALLSKNSTPVLKGAGNSNSDIIQNITDLFTNNSKVTHPEKRDSSIKTSVFGPSRVRIKKDYSAESSSTSVDSPYLFPIADPQGLPMDVYKQQLKRKNNRHEGQDYIYSKENGHLYVFDNKGELLAVTPAGIGQDKGDDKNTVNYVLNEDTSVKNRVGRATTPSGSYYVSNILDDPHTETVYGGKVYQIHNTNEAFNREHSTPALHPIYPSEYKKRVAIINSSSPDKRVSMGCINCHKSFLDQHPLEYKDSVYVTNEPLRNILSHKQQGGDASMNPEQLTQFLMQYAKSRGMDERTTQEFITDFMEASPEEQQAFLQQIQTPTAQQGGSPGEVVVEEGEVMRDGEGNIQQVTNEAPSHDDPYLMDAEGYTPVPQGKGGLHVSGIESVLSDSQSQINRGERKDNPKDRVIRIKKSEATAIAKSLGLHVKTANNMSPSKLFLELQKARDEQAVRLVKAIENAEGDSKQTQNSREFNSKQLESLPDDNQLYEMVFGVQEAKKEAAPEFEGLPDQHTMQYGGKSKPIVVSNLNDPKLKAYRDSLNLYKAYQMQDKLMGPGNKKQPDSDWSIKALKEGRIRKDDYQNEKDQFYNPTTGKKEYNFWARPEDEKLIHYYKSLGFNDSNIMYHSSPDVVHPTIKPIGTYLDGTADSPIYKKPVQPIIYKNPTLQAIHQKPRQSVSYQPLKSKIYNQVSEFVTYPNNPKVFGDSKGMIISEPDHNYKELYKSPSPKSSYESIQDYQNRVREDQNIKFQNKNISNFQQGGYSTTGYLNNSPHKNRKFNIIKSPHITMNGVDKPLLLMGDGGEVVHALPNSGEYYFPNSEEVLEIPYAQAGGYGNLTPIPKRGVKKQNTLYADTEPVFTGAPLYLDETGLPVVREVDLPEVVIRAKRTAEKKQTPTQNKSSFKFRDFLSNYQSSPQTQPTQYDLQQDLVVNPYVTTTTQAPYVQEAERFLFKANNGSYLPGALSYSRNPLVKGVPVQYNVELPYAQDGGSTVRVAMDFAQYKMANPKGTLEDYKKYVNYFEQTGLTYEQQKRLTDKQIRSKIPSNADYINQQASKRIVETGANPYEERVIRRLEPDLDESIEISKQASARQNARLKGESFQAWQERMNPGLKQIERNRAVNKIANQDALDKARRNAPTDRLVEYTNETPPSPQQLSKQEREAEALARYNKQKGIKTTGNSKIKVKTSPNTNPGLIDDLTGELKPFLKQGLDKVLKITKPLAEVLAPALTAYDLGRNVAGAATDLEIWNTNTPIAREYQKKLQKASKEFDSDRYQELLNEYQEQKNQQVSSNLVAGAKPGPPIVIKKQETPAPYTIAGEFMGNPRYRYPNQQTLSYEFPIAGEFQDKRPGFQSNPADAFEGLTGGEIPDKPVKESPKTVADRLKKAKKEGKKIGTGYAPGKPTSTNAPVATPAPGTAAARSTNPFITNDLNELISIDLSGSGTPLYGENGEVIGYIPTEAVSGVNGGSWNPSVDRMEQALKMGDPAAKYNNFVDGSGKTAQLPAAFKDGMDDLFGLKPYDLLPELLAYSDASQIRGVPMQQVRNPRIKLQRLNPQGQLQQLRENYLDGKMGIPNPNSSVGQAMQVAMNRNYMDATNDLLGNIANQNTQLANQEELTNAQYLMDEQQRNIALADQAFVRQLQAEDNSRVQKQMALRGLSDKLAQSNKAKNNYKIFKSAFAPNMGINAEGNVAFDKTGAPIAFFDGTTIQPLPTSSGGGSAKVVRDAQGNVLRTEEVQRIVDEYTAQQRKLNPSGIKKQQGGAPTPGASNREKAKIKIKKSMY